jgi:hypothetical protein
MTLDDKKDFIYRVIRLGMSVEDAKIAAECTGEEMRILDEDEAFEKKCDVVARIQEKELLEKLNQAMEMNLLEGKTVELRYKLGVMNSRYSGGKVDVGTGNKRVKINIDFGSGVEADDNTELYNGE